MADARAAILARVRRNLKAAGDETSRRETITARMTSHPRGPVPARGAGGLATFREMAGELDATTEMIKAREAIPRAVADYLRARNLPLALRHGADAIFAGLDWQGLSVSTGAADPCDEVSLSHARAGVAETGTLLLVSGTDNPTTLNLLPETHIVVLESRDIVAAYEDAIDKVRALGPLPRTLNFITGPSRTADVEQTIELGAHGPRRLHIIIVE